MQARHVPAIDGRYWAGITLASIFGTNLGDLYAHESGLGLLGGLPILVVLFAIVFVAERFDRLSHDAYYWLCIIIMRTGATNIADYTASPGLEIGHLKLSIGLAVLLVALVAWAARGGAGARTATTTKTLPTTDARYWLAMLTAGVLGTALGDALQSILGQTPAAAALGVLLAAALLMYRRGVLPILAAYWLTVTIARTAGTAIGDWLAENGTLHLGLPIATLFSGVTFASVLLLWRRRQPRMETAS